MSRGCEACGHTKREHNIPSRPDPFGLNDPNGRLCSAPTGNRLCLCPKYRAPR